jgi:DNA-binding XRE family transcriptional regulator
MTSRPDDPAGQADCRGPALVTARTNLRAGDRAFLRAMGKKVRLARVDREYTQVELAGHAGMSRNFVSSIERGTHGLDVLRLRWLADALDLRVDQLLPTGDETRAAAAVLDRRGA